MKIYTKTGDSGNTALFGGTRVSKDALRIAAYGTVDELNSFLGLARSATDNGELTRYIDRIQNDLFILGSDLATPLDAGTIGIDRIANQHVVVLEQSIDALEDRLEALRSFILPGGCETASRLHVCRAVCRRAEREIVRLSHDEPINELNMLYINRLSDFLFVLARFANKLEGEEEICWSTQ